MNEFIKVDPGELDLPPSRRHGADPAKLHRQIARYGRSIVGMPPLEVLRDPDGRLIVYNGVTRATRAAKLCPGVLVTVEVMGTFPRPRHPLTTVREKLP